MGWFIFAIAIIGFSIYASQYGEKVDKITSNKEKKNQKVSDTFDREKKQPLKTDKAYRFSNIKDILNLKDVVFLDTETTGLDKEDQIIEIAILDYDGNILLNSLVKPTVNINRKAQEVHGISKKDVANAPSWKDIYSDYLACTENKTILAYNQRFDKKLVQQSCKAHAITNKKRNWGCVMLAYAEFMGNLKKGWQVNHKLTTASFNCGVQIVNSEQGAHRALYDAGLALGVYKFMQIEVKGFLNE